MRQFANLLVNDADLANCAGLIISNMFRVKNKDAPFPEPYPVVKRRLGTIAKKEWNSFDGFKVRDNIDLCPQFGIQEQIGASECSLVFMVGEATMGKTFSGFMKALNGIDKENYTAKLISKRLQDSKKGGSLLRDFKVVFENFGGSEVAGSDYPTAFWPRYNSSVQMMHANFNTRNETEWKEFQDYAKKTQASYIYWDEVTEIEEFRAFAYLFSRNRDASGMPPQMVASFNATHEHWSTEFMRLAGYIGSDWYLDQSKLGKVVYFYIGGDTVESVIFADTKQEIIERCRLYPTESEKARGITAEHLVKSFTVLSGDAADNTVLLHITGGGSIANLYNVSETERQRIKHTYFGHIEQGAVTVPQRSMLDIFDNPYDNDTERYASMDMSEGGDVMPMMIWEGLTLIALEICTFTEPGDIEKWVASQLYRYEVPVENFAFDAEGSGFFMRKFRGGYPIVGKKRQMPEFDEHGNQVMMEQYFNLRSQLYGRLEAAFIKGEIACKIDPYAMYPLGDKKILTPFRNIILEERNIFRREDKNKRIYYRSKLEYRKAHKKSPDYIDTMSYRMVMALDARPKKEKPKKYGVLNYRLVGEYW